MSKMSAMQCIGRLQSEYIERMNKYLEEDAEDDLSFDETPYNGLSSRSHDVYNRFVNELSKKNINFVDTFPLGKKSCLVPRKNLMFFLGSRCIMVYPVETVELSCIFVPYIDRNTIEIKICKSNRHINDIMDSLPRNIWIYCNDDPYIIRSDNITR